MELELHEINVTLSNYQKQKIRNAFINREKIILRLSIDNLLGKDTLLVPTNFFGMRDSDDKKGFYASVDEETLEEMREEIELDLKHYKNIDLQKMLENLEYKSLEYKKFEILQSLKDKKLLGEMSKHDIYDNVGEYYGLFFNPGVDISKGKKNMKYKGIEKLREEIRKEVENLPKKIRKDIEKITDEELEARILRERETNEHVGIEFDLNYSFLNDLATYFVKNNIKKLFDSNYLLLGDLPKNL